MYNNPYHLRRCRNFGEFLVKPQKSNAVEIDYKTRRCLNESDNGKTIFEIRYHKYNKICEYRDRNKDIIFVNLSYIQNEKNLRLFLQTLTKNYLNKENNGEFITHMEHTKNKKLNLKNRDYQINIENYRSKISERKNESVESFISNLTFEVYNSD